MLVAFKTNIGQLDAARHGVEWNRCRAGAQIEVDDSTGAELCEAGFAQIVEGIAKEVHIKGVTEKAAADLKTYKKRQLEQKPKNEA